MENEVTTNRVPVIDLAGVAEYFGPMIAFLTRNVAEIAIIAGVAYMMYVTYKMQKARGVEARSKRTWKEVRADVRSKLKLTLWRKPRAVIMSKKRFKRQERMMAELVALQQVLAVEQCWVKGWITREYRDKCVNDIAFRFSIPAWFSEGRLKIVKAKIKKRRVDEGLPMTLDEAGFPKSIVPADRPVLVPVEKEERKSLFTKAA